MKPRRSLKARVVNALWLAFRPGSWGQKVVQWIVYAIILAVIAFAVMVRL